MHESIFTARNIKFIAICLGLLVVGFVLLGQGPVENPLSKSVAPVILVAVYCVLLPMAIMTRAKESSGEEQEQQNKKK
jgi:uncharacterized membrane protein